MMGPRFRTWSLAGTSIQPRKSIPPVWAKYKETREGSEGSRLNEYTIGLEVFDRPPNYDPQEDPILRNRISRLRLKLLKYYFGERVEIPDSGFTSHRGSSAPPWAPLLSCTSPDWPRLRHW